MTTLKFKHNFVCVFIPIYLARYNFHRKVSVKVYENQENQD